jgi:mevalonate kinase
MSKNFETQSFGKWILAGEHAVLRGVPAVVFPLKSRALQLTYVAGPGPLELLLDGEHGEELQLLVWGVLEKACELKKIKRTSLSGKLHLRSSIPVGAGMGASAALCVALTRWMGHLGFVKETEYYDFARTLENLFHGESSGVDIAVSLSGQGLLFSRQGKRQDLKLAWQPRWYISYSGKRGVTLDCVNKVKALIAQNPALGEKIDSEMKDAVEMDLKALAMGTEAEGLPLLAKAMDLANQCFHQWGLSEGAPQKQMDWLTENGALAVKPTGSGGGGYILSLWKQNPPEEVAKKLIPCF